MIKQIDHLGVAVRSLDEAIPYYERVLGLPCMGRETVADQKVNTAFFKVGEVMIELLEPTAEDSPIAKYLERNPSGGIHHIAFATPDVAGSLKTVAEAGVRLIHEQPIPGAHGKAVAFLHPKSTFGVLTEFCGPADHH
jgi:methylmalonyl-CoA/ethylmalonyl-CoA epimerase